jgi:DUF4097 and DUF4098 domain-containing protein YvlB
MPTFNTPEPISVTLDIYVGDTQITAGDRADTVVEVRPSNESKAVDVRAAEQTRVEYAAGKLLVKVPRPPGYVIGIGPGKSRSVDVRIELPAGSHLRGSSALGGFHCEGRFGECELKTGAGAIRLEHADAVRLNTGGGDITVDRVAGHAEVTTGVGEVRIREVDGTAVIKNSAGNNEIGEITGDLRVKTSSGDILIDRAHAAVEAKTSAGKVRIGEVSRGSIVLESSAGGLEVGIREGTAAWLDVHSTSGRVRNLLEASDAPEQADQTVEVRARTHIGDIVIRRSSLSSHE